MSRPFPVHPRGPRRKRVRAEKVLFACPQIAPDWELAALRALMKPQTRGAIENRDAGQGWDDSFDEVVREACREVKQRIGFGPPLHFPKSGDYYCVAEVRDVALEEAKGFALVVSKRLPELWFVLGRLFIRGGEFYRRERGHKLKLIVASNVHLTREIRSALRDLL